MLHQFLHSKDIYAITEHDQCKYTSKIMMCRDALQPEQIQRAVAVGKI